MSKEKIAAIKDAGVVGAGGAGFPTHVKVNATVKTVVVNAAECEPLLKVDQQLLTAQTDKFIKGLLAVVEMTGAEEGLVALKGKYKEAIKCLEEKIQGTPIKLHILKDFYPAGDEQVTVYEATKRLVPQGGIPLKVDCVVANVETLINIAESLDGKSVTHTYVTITGEVPNPVTLNLPIGLTVRESLALAGLIDYKGFSVIDGGPMMGKLVKDMEQPITKTTKGLIVLPNDHQLIKRRQLKFETIARKARQSCIQCRQCTDLCPRYMLGHNIEPHKVMRALINLPGQEKALNSVFGCSECGLCEQYVCPMGLSPRTINSMLKQELIKNGIKPGPGPEQQEVHKMRDYRQVPVKRLVSRIGLNKYDKYAPLKEIECKPAKVSLMLKQHVGAPSKPIVKIGEMVQKGQIVATIPDNALGANIHASISGKVTEINDRIIITAVEGSV